MNYLMMKLLNILAMSALAVQAADTYTWRTTSMEANTPATAYDWNDESNWDPTGVPAAHDNVVFPIPPNVYYVRLPDEGVVVGKLSNKTGNNHYMCLVGGRIAYGTADGTRGEFSYGGGWAFTDVEAGTPTDATMPYISGINLAGRAVATYQNFTPASGYIAHRLDKFASSSNPLRTDDIVIAGSRQHNPGSGSVQVFAPQGSDACTGEWTLTEGSPYATRVSSTAHALSAGTVVSCDGALPPGTFLKRIFSNSLIELSEPATEGGAKTLSFAAFTPEARINVNTFSRIGEGATDFALFKYRPQDTLVYEMTNYYGYAGQTSYIGLYPSQTEKGWHPGKHVFHNMDDRGAEIRLLNSDVELAGRTDGTATVFGDKVNVKVWTNCTASITVTNNVKAEIRTLAALAGTFVKKGGGSLAVCLADVKSAGGVSVEGGTLALTAKASLGGAAPEMGALSIAAGAVMQIPSNGLSVASLSVGPGAVVRGPGVLSVRGMTDKPAGLVLEGGASLACSVGEPEAVIDSLPEGEVVGHPMFWLDASKPNTLEYTTDENGTNYVTRWNDCREGEPMFCTNVVRRPVFVNGEAMTNKYVHLRRVMTYWLTNTESLVWSVPVGGIKAVFLVQDPRDGGGEILGHTSRLYHGQYYGTQGGPYYRGASSDIGRSLISPNYATHSVKFGRFYLNGREVCGYADKYLGPYSQLIEHHVNTNEYSCAANGRYDLWIDAFGMGYLDGSTYANGCNGCMRIHEYIIYTNSLTHAERTKVAQYLSRKWLGKDVAWTVTETNAASHVDAVAADGRAIDVAAGSSYAAMALAGDGELVKTGGGSLYVGNVTNARVTVKGGELVVRSLAATNTFVPDGAWVHVDASDPASAETYVQDGVAYVSKWRNLAGDGGYYNKYAVNNDHHDAFYRADAMNGLPLVDMGPLRWSGNTAPAMRDMKYTKADGARYSKLDKAPWVTSPALHTLFFVADTSQGGNSLIGGDNNGYPDVGFPHSPSPDFSTPIIHAAGHTWGYTAFSNEFNSGVSVFRTNGVPVNANATPFSGGQDVFAARTSRAARGDALGVYGYEGAVNGIAYGEVLLYEDKLDTDRFEAVEAYLRTKWRGEDVPGFAAARMDSLILENGASVRMCGYGYSKANPAGTLTVGALGGSGEVHGEVAVAPGGSLVAVVDGDGAVASLSVIGALDLSRGGTVVFAGETAKLATGLHPLVSATSVSWGGAWTCVSPVSTRTAALRLSGSTLYLNVNARGSVIIMR